MSVRTGWTGGHGLALVGAVVIFALLMISHGEGVLAGNLTGSDDMMRLAQVRGLLDGQGWFDVSQPRLITPEGGAMHWSRLPDLVLAGLILIAQPFVGPQGAQAFAALAFPALVLALVCVLTLLIVRRLGGGIAAQLFALLAIATFAPLFQFWPGRIDHHGFNAMLVMAGLAALGWSRRPVLGAALAGLATATMVSVAIETLPMALGLIGAAGLAWVMQGADQSRRLIAFGASLSGGAILLALGDAPGWGPQRAVCDAYGMAHLSAFLLTGAVFAAIGTGARHIARWPVRLAIGLAGALLVAAILAVTARDCLGDPYARVSETARESWLVLVSEAASLPQKFAKSPAVAIFYAGVPLAGAVALGWLFASSDAPRRRELAGLALMLAFALAVTVWQVRAMIFAQVLAVIPIALASAAALSAWQRRRGVPALLRASAVIALLSPMAWWSVADAAFPTPGAPVRGEGSASPAPGPSAGPSAGERLADCQSAAVYADLARLPPARVMTPIDLGAAVLVHTPHSVFAAPYHRNVAGIEAAIRVWGGTPGEARAELDRLGADYLISCAGLPELPAHARLHPDGLAAALLAGHVPDWLQPVATGTITVYRVRHGG